MHQVISSRTIRCAMLLLIAGAAAVGCSNNVTSTLTPRPHGPTSAPAPTATPTSAASGTMISPQAAATALAGAVAYFNALPHQNLNSDLTTLAAHMVSSGQFSTAKVGYGGITATFSNGATAVLFADTPETLAYPPASPAASTAVHRNAVPANYASAGRCGNGTGRGHSILGRGTPRGRGFRRRARRLCATNGTRDRPVAPPEK